jgi:hypothetical protein
MRRRVGIRRIIDGLGKPGRLRIDRPTITVELGPAPDAYTHYSPVMIAALSKDCRPERF